MSGWPAVRTWPAGPTAIGALPIMAGVLVVLFAAPLTAYSLDLLAGGNRPSPATDTVREFDPDRVVWLLAWSPLLSWAALVLGIPAALLAARHGLGGWLVALVAGAAAGTVSSPLVNGSWPPLAWTAELASVGAVLGLAFGRGVRLTAPRLFQAPARAY